MGTVYQYTCDQCSFETEVSGGFDVGMVSATQTISCRECGQLYDVVVGDSQKTRSEDVTRMPLRCPESKQHNVVPWTHPGPCPNCGATMTQGDMIILWD